MNAVAQSPSTHRRLWVTAGALSLGYVVLTLIGAVFQNNVTVGSSPSKVASALVNGSMSKQFTGGYIEFIATLVFLAGALLLARLLRGQDERTKWLSSCIAGTAVAYVAVQIATSFAGGAAALYDGHHGATLTTVTTVNDIRNFGFALTGGIGGALILAMSAAGALTRLLPRWLCYVGYVAGTACIATVPAVKAGAPQTMLWFAWLVVVGVVAMRQKQVAAHGVVQPAVATT